MLEQWLPALANILLQAVPGVQAAYTFDNLPSSLQALPAWLILTRQGSQELGGAGIRITQVQATLYHNPANLPEAYNFLIRAVDPVTKAVARNLTLGGLVSRCVPADPPSPWFEGAGSVNSPFGDKVYIGIIFNLTVKETTSFTVST